MPVFSRLLERPLCGKLVRPTDRLVLAANRPKADDHLVPQDAIDSHQERTVKFGYPALAIRGDNF
jgi:hypothetical protein